MSQNNSNQNTKADMLLKIAEINKVAGFDPAPFVMDFTDLATGEKHKRLPVMTQIAWFRMKYPEGKFAVQVTVAKDCFIATARVYTSYKDSVDEYLAEASVSRGKCQDKPSVSPREWAQTAALGVALRNAGFGLQFEMAGDDYPEIAADEFKESANTENTFSTEDPLQEKIDITEEPKKELTLEERVEIAMKIPCPLPKHAGRTLGDLVSVDPNSLKYLAEKYLRDENIRLSAKMICDYIIQNASA